jgi:hypothetical protein
MFKKRLLWRFIPPLLLCVLVIFSPWVDLRIAATREKDRSETPYSTQKLFGLGGQRIFEGEHLKEIAFPLGGIGPDTVSLGGRGNLRDWEIFNRPGKGVNLPFTFFALYFEEEKGRKGVRVLEGPQSPPFTGNIVIWFWGSAGCGRIFAFIIPSNHREEV